MSLRFFSANTGSGGSLRDLLITIAGALLSVFVLLNVLVPQQQHVPVSKPTSADKNKHGLYAIYKWLSDSGVSTLSLRKPVHRMHGNGLPLSGNVMLISLPYAKQALESEWSAINQWIEQGNTAVVFVAGLYAKPEWFSSADIFAPIKKLTADEFSLSARKFTIKSKEASNQNKNIELSDLQGQLDLFQAKRLKLSPVIKHPLFENIDALDAYYLPLLMQAQETDDQPLEKVFYSLESDSARLGMGLLTVDNELTSEHADEVLSDIAGHYVMWLLPVGDGWVYLTAFPDLLSNRVLKQSQNAPWFTQLLQLHLSSSGYVIFNDYPFGLSELYDADAFFSDRRLHYTFVFIALFWLVYALAFSPRLAPAHTVKRLPGNKDFIDAAAGFFSRRLKTKAVAKALSTALIDELQSRTQLHGESLWNWLQDHPNIYHDDVDTLKRASGYEKGRVKLIQLTQAINRIYIVLTNKTE